MAEDLKELLHPSGQLPARDASRTQLESESDARRN